MITILVMLLCLLTAGGAFLLSGKNPTASIARAASFLGTDIILDILDPETAPTADPASDPTASSAADPTLPPAPGPTADSANDPTANPTTDPAVDETAVTASDRQMPAKAASSKEGLAEKNSTQDYIIPSRKDLTKTQKKYVEAWENFHGRSFLINGPLHDYNWKYLSYNDQGKLRYKGDKKYTVRYGIDVSEFQGKIDWKKVRKDGIEFAFIRAGGRMFESGELSEDSRAVRNLRQAKEAGLEVGVYVFSQAISRKEAREEARLCLDVIEKSGVEVTLPVAFDPEIQIEYYARINDIDGQQFTDDAIAFCSEIKKAGYTPAIYANCSTQTDILDMSRLTGITMWYADYNAIPESPYRFTFLQYSNTGVVDGIPELADLNIWFVEKEEEQKQENGLE